MTQTITVRYADGSEFPIHVAVKHGKTPPANHMIVHTVTLGDSPAEHVTLTLTPGRVTRPDPPKPEPPPEPPAPPNPAPPPSPTPTPNPNSPSGPPGAWTLKWSDEFADLSNWWLTWPPAETPQLPMQTSEVACYDPACVSIENGVCTLSAIVKGQTVGGRVFEYATAVMASKDTGLFALGDYVEFTACLQGDVSSGVIDDWQGCWTCGPDWPAGGEDDIVESWGGNPTYHFHSPQGAPGGVASGGFAGSFHTFGSLYGTDGTVTDFYDGVEVGSVSSGGVTGSEWLMASIMLDPSVNPTALVVPCRMQLQSVKVWTPA